MKTPPFIRETKMQILVAEDDDGHAELIMEGLRSSGINNEIKRFCDGEKILAYLEEIKSKRERQNGIRDLLLLLDIKEYFSGNSIDSPTAFHAAK
jgi:CheY-like chemotaxis protein